MTRNSIFGCLFVGLLAIGQFALGTRLGGWRHDNTSTSIHDASFNFSLGSTYVWLEPGERLSVRYDAKVKAGDLNFFVTNSSPWTMGHSLYGSFKLTQTAKGSWDVDGKPGWNHVMITTGNDYPAMRKDRFSWSDALSAKRDIEYTIRWAVK